MKINVLGSGYMGKQICSLFVNMGYEVIIWQNSDQNLDELIKNEIKKIEKLFNNKASGYYKVVNNLDQLEQNFTIETLTENIEIKKNIISKLKFKKNIFSNTSSLSASKLGKFINILHFMNPISVPMVELYKTEFYIKI
jgi:3-hydroxyacyl-CoA dehydrogenase